MSLPFFLWRCTIVPFMNHQEIIERMRGYIREPAARIRNIKPVRASQKLGRPPDRLFLGKSKISTILRPMIPRSREAAREHPSYRCISGVAKRDLIRRMHPLNWGPIPEPDIMQAVIR